MLLFVLALGLLACGEPTRARSLLLITLDTTRADHLGPYGYEGIETPTLDRLAAQGVLFERAFAAAPETLPSHTTMMTGLYPPSHGVRLNLNFKVPAAVTTLAELLEAEGFETAAVVAAGVLSSQYGLNQGFFKYQDPPSGPGLPEVEAAEVTRLALETADEFEGGRFFLWVHFYNPHSPFEPRGPLEAPEGSVAESTELYDLEISNMDYWVGKLLEGLKSRSLMTNTAVVVVGDHGESLGDHGETYHTLFVYDSTQHVPLIVQADGVAAGRRVSDAVSTVDVFATALGLLGVERPERTSSRVLPGLGLEAEQAEGLPTGIYSESMAPPLRHGWAALQAVRWGRWLYVRAPREELYDLEVDPEQVVDVALEEEEQLANLRRVLGFSLREMPDLGLEDKAGFQPGADERAKLEALGYIGTNAAAGAIDMELEGLDPKDMIDVAEAYQLARLARRVGRPQGSSVATR